MGVPPSNGRGWSSRGHGDRQDDGQGNNQGYDRQANDRSGRHGSRPGARDARDPRVSRGSRHAPYQAPPSGRPYGPPQPATATGSPEAADTAHVPAASLPSILASERVASSAPPASAHSQTTPARIEDMETRDLPGISMARRRGYDEKARALADVDTLHSLAVSPGAAARHPAHAVHEQWASLSQSKRLRYAALVLVLALVAVRAGIASASFMVPGGGILGWSVIPKTTSPFRPPTTSHQLTPSEYAGLLVGQLSLDQELGQMMLMELGGTQPTLSDDQMVSTQDVGGILFFAYNITGANEIRSVTAHLRNEAPIPLLMTVDQEGGIVNRFASIVGPVPAAASLTGPDQARARGAQDAGILHDNGFNLNLAPVADVGTSNPQLTPPNNPKAGRTFGDDPTVVATMAGAYLDGLQQSGTVTGTVKHFAGLGGTTTDPHSGLPILNLSPADWERIHVAPFRTLLAQHDVRAIMVTHVMIPQVDPNLPTSLSPIVIDGTLRHDLGFQGVVITDDVFKMEAINERYPGPQAAVLAVEAGADQVIGPTSQTVQATKNAFKQAIAAGQLTKARIDLSVQRILTLKIEMGLIPMPASSATATPSPTPKKGHDATPSPAAYRSPDA